MLTIPFIAFAAGLALIALGLLGGGIEVKEIRIPQLPIVPRAACILFGCILLGSVLFDRKLFDQLQEATATTTAPAPAPAPASAPKHELGAAINRHLIEVHDVILQRVGNKDEVADVLRIGRHLNACRIFYRAHRSDAMHRGADSTETLREEPRFAGIASLQDGLDAPEHGAGGPRIIYFSAVDLHINSQMAFDSGNWINRDAIAHRALPLESIERLQSRLCGDFAG